MKCFYWSWCGNCNSSIKLQNVCFFPWNHLFFCHKRPHSIVVLCVTLAHYCWKWKSLCVFCRLLVLIVLQIFLYCCNPQVVLYLSKVGMHTATFPLTFLRVDLKHWNVRLQALQVGSKGMNFHRSLRLTHRLVLSKLSLKRLTGEERAWEKVLQWHRRQKVANTCLFYLAAIKFLSPVGMLTECCDGQIPQNMA